MLLEDWSTKRQSACLPPPRKREDHVRLGLAPPLKSSRNILDRSTHTVLVVDEHLVLERHLEKSHAVTNHNESLSLAYDTGRRTWRLHDVALTHEEAGARAVV